jgi:hypothetical protein
MVLTLPLKASPTTTSQSRDFSIRITVLLLAWSCMSASAQQKFFPERIGDLGVKRDPATWSSPEAVVHDLRSDDAAVRLKAMRLVGVNEDFFGTGATPEEIELRYTTFGIDDQIVAVITVEQSSFQYAAVAIPRAGTWTRLGVFECWCKYEAPLDDFVQVAPVASGQRLELQIMVRASGGGTGQYEQTEAWFRARNGILELVLSFTRRQRSCAPSSETCSYERRWFDGNQFVEGKNPAMKFAQDDAGTLREHLLKWAAEDNTLRSLTCTPYKWDAVNFKYTPSGPAHPCKYEPPK